jgi:hypothetical protein
LEEECNMKKSIVMSLVGTALVVAGAIVENKFGIVDWVKSKIDQVKSKTELTAEQPAETEEK